MNSNRFRVGQIVAATYEGNTRTVAGTFLGIVVGRDQDSLKIHFHYGEPGQVHESILVKRREDGWFDAKYKVYLTDLRSTVRDEKLRFEELAKFTRQRIIRVGDIVAAKYENEVCLGEVTERN